MSERLYRVADRDAMKRLRASGARIVFRFRGGVVLREPLDHDIDGVIEVDPGTLAPAKLTADNLGELAFALRQSPAWRARKARRPAVDVGMDLVIAGTDGKTP